MGPFYVFGYIGHIHIDITCIRFNLRGIDPIIQKLKNEERLDEKDRSRLFPFFQCIQRLCSDNSDSKIDIYYYPDPEEAKEYRIIKLTFSDINGILEDCIYRYKIDRPQRPGGVPELTIKAI